MNTPPPQNAIYGQLNLFKGLSSVPMSVYEGEHLDFLDPDRERERELEEDLDLELEPV